MRERYRKKVEFLVIYIKEAHPEDGWVLESNRTDEIKVLDPATFDARATVARSCATRHAITMPVVIDSLDNQVASRYGGWPDRLYLIGKDGRVAFQGGEGPFGFKPAELEQAIEKELGKGKRKG
jgi:hypothetical protein